MDQHQQLKDAAAFLAVSGMRPRAIVIVGAGGIGKTTFIDRVQVEALAAGRTTIVAVDDAHMLDQDAIEDLRRRISADTRTLLLAAHDGTATAFMRMVESTCERRLIELSGLDEDASRSLLAELGVQPWTLHARQLLDDSAGVPRTLIDRSFGELDLSRLPAGDAADDGDSWSHGMARRARLSIVEDDAAHEALVAELHATVQSGGSDPIELAEAITTLSEIALLDSQLEEAVQLGEQVASMATAPERLRILGSANASAARATRGEPTGMLSMHALAGRASRADMPLVEAYVWYRISWCAGVLGDVSTSERAAIRSVQLYDAIGSVMLGLRSRQVLGDLHLAANRADPARSYYGEIRTVAAERGLHRVRIVATASEAHACFMLGLLDDACRRADESLELALRTNGSRIMAVDSAVIAARAYAAAGSVDLALAPIEVLAADLGDSHSPDFWLVLEAIRVLGRAGTDPAAFQKWLALLGGFEADVHGGALRAAHAEADAWRAAVAGRRAEAARLAERARQLWITAERHDELSLTEPLVQQSPIDHGPRISLVGGPSQPQEDPAAFEALTRREREIARYVAGGLTNPEIAAELHLSPRTVEHHVASILRKLELPSRRELVRGRV